MVNGSWTIRTCFTNPNPIHSSTSNSIAYSTAAPIRTTRSTSGNPTATLCQVQSELENWEISLFLRFRVLIC
ncbi:hypothetical protein LINPERPRIM_LOCUS41009 [Linum perenne]